MRPPDAALRARRPGRAASSTGSSSSSATAPSGSPRRLQDEAPRPAHRASSSRRSSGAPATPSASASPPSRTTRWTTTTATSSCSPATRPCSGPRPSPPSSPCTGGRDAACTVLTAERRTTRPATAGWCGAGRPGDAGIVEDRDADDEERAINEINTSIYCFRRSVLAPALRRTSPDNAQGEYYLTDVVEVLADGRLPGGLAGRRRRRWRRPASTTGSSWPSPRPGCGDRTDRRAGSAAGVTMVDPERTYVDTTVRLGTDVTLFPGHPPAGRDGDRRRRRDRPRHPTGRLRRRRERPPSSRSWAATPRSAPAPSSARSPCSSPGSQIACRERGPAPFYTASADDD